MSEGRSGFGDFLTGVLVGGAIAYVIGVLNAPRPGEETRQMWKERGRELRDQAMDTVQSTVDKTGKLVSDSRYRVNEQVSDLKDRSGGVVSDVREQVSEGLRTTADKVDPNKPTSSPPMGPEI